ncbi:Uncharacterised protein [Mycobacteroides abscessus subsp. abscessus]|nr:Uncharacterised protein [Mycobacteroides abscessus subsp. abscessus]
MHSSPSVYQRDNRFTRTSSSFTSSIDPISLTTSVNSGTTSTRSRRNASTPRARSRASSPLRMNCGICR